MMHSDMMHGATMQKVAGGSCMLRVAAAIIAAMAFSGLAATAGWTQGAALSGQYRCVQNCKAASPAYVNQNGLALSLLNEAGQYSKAWIDRPGHLWAQAWNEGAVYAPDGSTIRFDRGSVWQRDALAPAAAGTQRPYVEVPRRPESAAAPQPPPSAWQIYQSLRREELCWLPTDHCDNTQRVAN